MQTNRSQVEFQHLPHNSPTLFCSYVKISERLLKFNNTVNLFLKAAEFWDHPHFPWKSHVLFLNLQTPLCFFNLINFQ